MNYFLILPFIHQDEEGIAETVEQGEERQLSNLLGNEAIQSYILSSVLYSILWYGVIYTHSSAA